MEQAGEAVQKKRKLAVVTVEKMQATRKQRAREAVELGEASININSISGGRPTTMDRQQARSACLDRWKDVEPDHVPTAEALNALYMNKEGTRAAIAASHTV